MDRDFIIWAAGFFDGEESIHIKSSYYSITVVIVNTHRPSIEEFKCFPGRMSVAKRDDRGNYHNLFRFRFSYVGAFQFLTLVLPYLRVKQAAAQIALEYLSLALEHKRIPTDIREDFYYRLQETKEQGKGR